MIAVSFKATEVEVFVTQQSDPDTTDSLVSPVVALDEGQPADRARGSAPARFSDTVLGSHCPGLRDVTYAPAGSQIVWQWEGRSTVPTGHFGTGYCASQEWGPHCSRGQPGRPAREAPEVGEAAGPRPWGLDRAFRSPACPRRPRDQPGRGPGAGCRNVIGR